MQKFNVYLPINKSFSKGAAKLIETSADGSIQRTRYQISGIASTSCVDRDMEVMSKGCLLKMQDQINKKKLPIFGNHEHNWENMLGYADKAQMIGDDLVITITTTYEDLNPKIHQLAGNLEAGLPLALSIGGKVLDSKDVFNQQAGKKIKVIEDVDLLETSIVGIGANQEAFLASKLSLPEQIAKSLKEEVAVTELEKAAGQAGMTSYGKLGETTPEANCPVCGRPAQLMDRDKDKANYVCSIDGTKFSVSVPTKANEATEAQQPVKPGAKPIDEQVQPVLGKDVKIDKEEMTMATKDAEATAEAKKEAPCHSEDDEYKRFKELMARFKKEAESEAEAKKTEGIATPPGADNAKPQYSIGASKSLDTFMEVKKAFKDNVAVEGLVNQAKPSEEADLSFKSIRKNLLVRK